MLIRFETEMDGEPVSPQTVMTLVDGVMVTSPIWDSEDDEGHGYEFFAEVVRRVESGGKEKDSLAGSDMYLDLAEDHDDEHEAHSDEAAHTEFHAEYMLTCGNPNALSNIQFAYFDAFENALELEVQIVTATGAKAFEVERADPTLDLRGMF